MKNTIQKTIALVLLFSLLGCGTSFVAKKDTFDSSTIKKIAVLPFYNISGHKDAGRVVSEAYMTEIFKSGKYDVEEPGNVRHFMVQERVGVVGELEIEKIQILGKRLKVDAVLVGTVEEYEDRSKESVVAISSRLVATETGEVVWMNYRRKKGSDYTKVFDFGAVFSVALLANKVVEEMVDSL